MKIKLYFIILLILLGLINASNNKKWTIIIEGGTFIPSDQRIIGNSHFWQNETNTGNLSANYEMFGTMGKDFRLSTKFNFNSIYAIQVNSGINILSINNTFINNGQIIKYKNQLTYIPVILTFLFQFKSDYSKLIPYIGYGISYYFTDWKEQTEIRNGNNIYIDERFGINHFIGLNIIGGIDFPVYYDIILSSKIIYSFIPGTIKLKYTEAGGNAGEYEFHNLNLGGLSLRIGVGLQF